MFHRCVTGMGKLSGILRTDFLFLGQNLTKYIIVWERSFTLIKGNTVVVDLSLICCKRFVIPNRIIFSVIPWLSYMDILKRSKNYIYLLIIYVRRFQVQIQFLNTVMDLCKFVVEGMFNTHKINLLLFEISTLYRCNKTKLRGRSPRANYTDRRLSAS
jgi:hypothetical protein